MTEWALENERVKKERAATLAFDDDYEDEDEDVAETEKPRQNKARMSQESDSDDEDDDSGGWDAAPDEDVSEESTQTSDKPKKKKSDTTWMQNLRRKASGEVEPVLNNAALICENDPRIAKSLGYNEFTHDPVALRPVKSKAFNLPSRPMRGDEKTRGRRWEEADDASVKYICSGNSERGGYECDFSGDKIQDAVLIAGRNNPIHPVKYDIEACHMRWQNEGSTTGHIEQLFQTFFGRGADQCPRSRMGYYVQFLVPASCWSRAGQYLS